MRGSLIQSVSLYKLLVDWGTAGLTMQVGGFLESPLGMTAATHLALTHDAIRHRDFDTPLLLTADPVVGGIRHRPGGVVEVPTTPGLGASIDESWLEEAE